MISNDLTNTDFYLKLNIFFYILLVKTFKQSCRDCVAVLIY